MRMFYFFFLILACDESWRPLAKINWKRKWQPTLLFLPGESRDRGAWRAAICGAAQSWTPLRWLSSSSSGNQYNITGMYISVSYKPCVQIYSIENCFKKPKYFPLFTANLFNYSNYMAVISISISALNIPYSCDHNGLVIISLLRHI